ncbi:unnamed protein product, partial [Medioppia subpectinata]
TECNTSRLSRGFSGGEDISVKMLTISASEYFHLKEWERKAIEYEQKIMDLNEELRGVLMKAVEMNEAKKVAEERTDWYRNELYHMSEQFDSQRRGSHAYFNRNKPSFFAANTSNATKAQKSLPNTHQSNSIPDQIGPNIRPIYHNKKSIPFVEY